MLVDTPPTMHMVGVCHGELALFNHEASMMMHSAICADRADTPTVRECMSRLWSCRSLLDEICALLQQDTAIFAARTPRHREECDEEEIRGQDIPMAGHEEDIHGQDIHPAPMEEDRAQPPEHSGTPLTLCK